MCMWTPFQNIPVSGTHSYMARVTAWSETGTMVEHIKQLGHTNTILKDACKTRGKLQQIEIGNIAVDIIKC